MAAVVVDALLGEEFSLDAAAVRDGAAFIETIRELADVLDGNMAWHFAHTASYSALSAWYLPRLPWHGVLTASALV